MGLYNFLFADRNKHSTNNYQYTSTISTEPELENRVKQLEKKIIELRELLKYQHGYNPFCGYIGDKPPPGPSITFPDGTMRTIVRHEASTEIEEVKPKPKARK